MLWETADLNSKNPNMRHYKRLKKLGLPKNHRVSLLRNLLDSLVSNGKIRTTESRAKALAAYLGRIMTLLKAREPREVMRVMPKYSYSKKVSFKLLNELNPIYEKRTSGFTRITQIGT